MDVGKRRLILLGIDGMDFDYTESILDNLPNIKKLSRIGIVKPLKSVFPPDSVPSWITCYTGKDPSEHGVLESADYFLESSEGINIDPSTFRGSTFWDVLGESGMKVCVVNPFMAYPVWPVNGLMVNGPVFITGDIQVSDPKLLEGIRTPKTLGGITDFPSKKTLQKFCKKVFEDTKDQMEFGINILKKNRPQLFFQVFLTMDRMQHFTWRYSDRNDPTYPGKNEYEGGIEDFYIYIDDVIGNFLDAMESDERLIVISDHGHGRRCTHCFNINEYLRHRGYVESKADGKIISSQLIVEKLKNRFLKFMDEHDLEDYISMIATFIPNATKLKKGKYITDNSKNKAYASDFTGTNSFGGICINKNLVKDYEEFRVKLINELVEVTYEGCPVFNWIKKREEMYSGPFLDRYPDILFYLEEKFGVSWSLHTKLFSANHTHKKISGGHRELGIFVTNIPSYNLADQGQVKISNLFPTILDFFGFSSDKFCRGNSFLKIT